MGWFKNKKNEKKVSSKEKTNKKSSSKETVKASSKKAIYRVVYDKEKQAWVIKKDGAKRIIASFETKEKALARVKDLSQSNDVGFIVHKKDGKFQKKS